MKSLRLLGAALCLLQTILISHAAPTALAVKLTPSADRVRVEIGGQLFTEYIFGAGATRSYCYPVLASDGTPLTRNFPMKKVEGEDTDHPWHRSLYFAHSMVNGVDFWNEGNGDVGRSPKEKGRVVHDRIVETAEKVGVASLSVSNRWIAPDGKLICTDSRTIRFQGTADARMIDYEITLHALPEVPLVMGDNKDGTMAIRLAQWMTMPHKVKQSDGTSKDTGGHGHIVTSTDKRDADAWGKRADWCDYFAEHDGKTYGVAIFDHPGNLRHPTWWMARDYGLFGANPFGQHDFEKLPDQPHLGDYTIPAGGSLTLRYRFYFYNGDEKAAKIAERYAEYSAEK